MKFEISKNQIASNLRETLRHAGYFGIEDRLSNKTSYVRRLSQSQHYPRFHLYIAENENSYYFNLHLDQKKASYLGQTAHSGEYEDSQIKEETDRIKAIIS